MKTKSSAATRVARQPALHRANIPWTQWPYQTIQNAARISGRSTGGIYGLVHAGVLEADTVAGKTLIKTASLLALLSSANPWRPNRDRVSAAVAQRIAAAIEQRVATRRRGSRRRARPVM